MIVWGGTAPRRQSSNTGGRYDPATEPGRRRRPARDRSHGARGHTAVWTGSRDDRLGWVDTSYQLEPAAATTRPPTPGPPTSTGANVPTARSGHTAVWTGTEMIVWGPDSRHQRVNTAAATIPSPIPGARPRRRRTCRSRRYSHTAVWTGTEMIVWGGVEIPLPNAPPG